jgi:hypothetical protein
MILIDLFRLQDSLVDLSRLQDSLITARITGCSKQGYS